MKTEETRSETDERYTSSEHGLKNPVHGAKGFDPTRKGRGFTLLKSHKDSCKCLKLMEGIHPLNMDLTSSKYPVHGAKDFDPTRKATAGQGIYLPKIMYRHEQPEPVSLSFNCGGVLELLSTQSFQS